MFYMVFNNNNMHHKMVFATNGQFYRKVVKLMDGMRKKLEVIAKRL